MTFICSELFSRSHDGKIFTVSNKYCTLARSNVYLTIIGVIDVHVGSNIKYKVFRLFAIVNIVLLTFNRIDFFHFKLINFVFKSVVVWIVLFSYGFWFQDVWVRLFLFLFYRFDLCWFCLYILCFWH